MDGYEVVLDDLRALGDSFDHEAGALEGLKSKTNQPAPDTGDGDCTGTLSDVLDNLSTIYGVLVDVIHGHAGALRSAHDTYQGSDHDAHELYDNMQKAFQGE